ncbi:MAG: glycosyltransferase family 4 protein [Anaerolineae bacterium]|nr:glycosyltransferase family 4 protein [Anaerolineae bacterium]
MRIGMIAPISWRVPPRGYGPWERVVSLLTEGLVERGLDVTLFATEDSLTRAKLAAVCPRPYSEDSTLDPKVWECLHIAHAFERAAEFDLLHNHFDFLPLSYSALTATPVLTTIHGFSSEKILPVYQKYNNTTYYVAISNADRHPSLDYAATVYHGIPMAEFSLRPSPDDYLLFFGRIHPDKGVVEAIEVAHRTGRRLIIAGLIQDQAYFYEKVAPHLDNSQISYIGLVEPGQRNEIMGGAYALLHLINFAEPFGLSMIEAMACGTPVIAHPLGSIPEVIKHQQTGFIVDNQEEAVAAVQAVDQLDRAFIRRYIAQNFSCDQMVEGYIRVYQHVLEQHQATLYNQIVGQIPTKESV